jgi:hypothetical protein
MQPLRKREEEERERDAFITVEEGMQLGGQNTRDVTLSHTVGSHVPEGVPTFWRPDQNPRPRFSSGFLVSPSRSLVRWNRSGSMAAPPAAAAKPKLRCSDRDAVVFWNSIAKSQPKKVFPSLSPFYTAITSPYPNHASWRWADGAGRVCVQ